MKRHWLFLIIIGLFCFVTACGKSPTQSDSVAHSTSSNGQLDVHYIDAGQADATLFRYSEDQQTYTILYDTGDWKSNDVNEYLASQAINNIDLIIISHPDADHIGQLAEILQTYETQEVWMSGNESSSQTFQKALEAVIDSGANYEEPRVGEQFVIGPLEIDILYPKEITGEANKESLSVRLSYDQMRFLFTGDAGKAEEREMLTMNDSIDADFLQLGHHGSNTSTAAEFVEAVNPQVAIYSAGKDNNYGHPHKETIKKIKNAGIDLYGTDNDGTIIITTNGTEYQISTEKGKDECIAINQASHDDLQNIIHIGSERATALIDLRPYQSLNDLTKIKGISTATLDDIKKQGLACMKGADK
ncbi:MULTISPECIES: MBL fold metallo-hydrolase [Virgibacillus]|uniref:MBL fold metallo-hydrolase n=1 Tax=Virgibacillus TaxID=84406 RepID=UPI000EF480A5|nr:MBL fold metallo-hydrolase [Virgibacillus sp. Bac332]